METNIQAIVLWSLLASSKGTPLSLHFKALVPVARISFRSLKRILDHSRVCSTATPKLALRAQTLVLQPFRFTKNG
jgi:hypothetical protein